MSFCVFLAPVQFSWEVCGKYHMFPLSFVDDP